MLRTAEGKFTLLLIFVCASITTASAQVEFGLKGGLNESEIMTSDQQFVVVNGNTQQLRNFPRVGFHGGVLVSIPLSKKFSFQPEAMFSTQGANGKPTLGYLVSATEEYRFNYIDVPLLLKYTFPSGLFLETGPQIGYLVSVDIDEDVVGSYYTSHYHPKSQYKSTDLSWALGAGYLSPVNIGFDIRYNLGLTDFSNGSPAGMQSTPVQNGSVRNSVIQIGVFYLFGKPRIAARRES
ncbi:MAG: porin family protein [Bacteroidota bacterium]|nr:porin family protein [Bacteroidota bacterium]MDP4247894.1 porin family protein [Bacteroidota bacterium]MDP4255712.1 porin family protein [Bacteroidota bacterium]MDP4257461.1 porin family protein [Bacteroidota bacterium]